MRRFFLALVLAFPALLAGASIELSWADNSSNEDGFGVERRIDAAGTSWAEIGTVGAGVTVFLDRNCVPGVAYVYRIRAFNEFGFSGYTNEARATAQGSPKAPTLARARAVPERGGSTSGGGISAHE